MSPIEIVALLALTVYAVVKQTQRHEVVGAGRFKFAIIYAVVAVAVGGFSRPDTPTEWALLTASLALSVVVGLARGRLTRVWDESRPDGPHVYSQGTPLTIGLFVGLVAVKFGLGAVAVVAGLSDDGGFGEILLMIALMVAVQAEIIWRRARATLAPPAAGTG